MLKVLRITLLILWFMFSSVVVTFYCLLRYGHPLNSYVTTRFACVPCLWILGIKVEILNPERLTKEWPVVYLANHQSWIDVFVFGHFFPKHSFVVAKESLKYMPFFGWAFAASGNIFVKRGDKKASIAMADTAAEYMLKENKSFFLFPEGTRSRGKGLGAFKKGGFHVAIQTGRPVVGMIAEDYKKINLNRWKNPVHKVYITEPIFIKKESMEEQIQELRELFLQTN